MAAGPVILVAPTEHGGSRGLGRIRLARTSADHQPRHKPSTSSHCRAGRAGSPNAAISAGRGTRAPHLRGSSRRSGRTMGNRPLRNMHRVDRYRSNSNGHRSRHNRHQRHKRHPRDRRPQSTCAPPSGRNSNSKRRHRNPSTSTSDARLAIIRSADSAAGSPP